MTDYEKYLFNCYYNGDIWNLDNKPYTEKEWRNQGCPLNGGIPIIKNKSGNIFGEIREI